jgi:lipopolysaccharide/colanic/teichoic acid biosynthesis glycosyltransferase
MGLIAAVVHSADGGSVSIARLDGLNGRRFTIIKFRSMHEDAERHLGAIWSYQTILATRGRPPPFVAGLDELPQLWNVLHGDMSLIGRGRNV